MAEIFETFDQMVRSGYVLRITDNGGEGPERYAVMFSDGDALMMSEGGKGVSEIVRKIAPNFLQDMTDAGGWKDVSPDDLSEESRDHVLDRVNDGLEEVFGSATSRPPRNREDVGINDRTRSCAGQGIWEGPEGLMIALEEGENAGPYASPLEAFRASLPNSHALEKRSELLSARPDGEREEETETPSM